MKHLHVILNAKERFLASLSHVTFEIEMPGGGRKTVTGYLDICRIPANKYPKDYNKYSVRHSADDDSVPVSIERQVYVNHYGDFLCKEDLPLQSEANPQSYINIIDWNFLNPL